MRSHRLLGGFMLAAALALAGACAGEAIEDLGPVTDGKGDVPEIDREITLQAASAGGKPSKQSFMVEADGDFSVELSYEGDATTRLTVWNQTDDSRFGSDTLVRPNLIVRALAGSHSYKIRIESFSTLEVSARLHVRPKTADVSPEVAAAAAANLHHVAAEIDMTHLANYGMSGDPAKQFLDALAEEYASSEPDQYKVRMQALASMIFFAEPNVLPPEGGKLTPFHGLDMEQFDALMELEDFVFDSLAEEAGTAVGVRPFSVCETRFMIETFVRPRSALPTDLSAYRSQYQAFAPSCPQADLDEWYNFRGLGALRPSWVESNIQDRFLRRMVKKCKQPTGEWVSPCERWTADRLAYRQDGNRQLAARMMFYAPDSQEEYLAETSNQLLLLEDRNGDKVGEMVRPGPTTLTNGEQGTLEIQSTGEFSGELHLVKSDGGDMSVRPRDVVAEDAVHPDWDPSLIDRKDWGLLSLFSQGDCTSASLSPESCPLLRRFFVMIDRHEDFYQTYTGMNPDFQGISSQPSPLVACSITLAASHQWDSAGTPEGGTAGFIYLMRIPFKQILAGSRSSISTLSPGPEITAIQDLADGSAELDMDKVWVDVASLSNNQFASEHEISKIGAVPAEQIEGILVVRRPASF